MAPVRSRAETALVVGFGATGQAVSRHLVAAGWTVEVVDDRPTDRMRAAAAESGVVLHDGGDPDRLAGLVGHADLVVPSPGVPSGHPVYELARSAGVPLVSEVELAARQASAPLVAVTGTNGKTTVTTMVASMLVEAGWRAVAAGNIGLPLIDAVAQDVDVLVAEVSSFQLQYTDTFRPAVAVWLNFAEDHLDWHPDLDHYAAAKARIWANQAGDDVAVVNAEDPVVMAAAGGAPARLVTFGLDRGDYRVEGARLVGPEGPLVEVTHVPRRLPHDIANGLAAAAAAEAAGASPEACRSVLTTFEGLPHRVQLVGESGGVRFYDDSKATTPASVLAALQGFESVVLIAGGRNKGLDLTPLAAEVDRLRGVVAIGDAAPDVELVFGGGVPTHLAWSMEEAVDAARRMARPGDAVLLSPGCASYDWYSSYAERGDDFARVVRDRQATDA